MLTRKRILTVAACVFFLLIGVATTTRNKVESLDITYVDWDIQQLEARRNSLKLIVDELEQRCKELENRISEQENMQGDDNGKETDP